MPTKNSLNIDDIISQLSIQFQSTCKFIYSIQLQLADNQIKYANNIVTLTELKVDIDILKSLQQQLKILRDESVDYKKKIDELKFQFALSAPPQSRRQ